MRQREFETCSINYHNWCSYSQTPNKAKLYRLCSQTNLSHAQMRICIFSQLKNVGLSIDIYVCNVQ